MGSVATETIVPPSTAHTPAATQPRVRRPTATRRPPPVTVVNYGYLRRDLTILGILAPSMIVLVVVAFFIFH